MKYKVRDSRITKFFYKGRVFEVKKGIVEIPNEYTNYFENRFGDILVKIENEIPVPEPPIKKERR